MLHPISVLVVALGFSAVASSAVLNAKAEEQHRRFAKAAVLAGGDPAHGGKLYNRYGCEACHSMTGQGLPRGRVGPDLTGFAERAYIAGRLRNEPDLLVQWIEAPQLVDPSTAMPNLAVTPQDARDLAAWLYAAT